MAFEVEIKKLTDTARVPEQATKGDAGFDLYADITEPVVIYPNTTKKIPTGIAMSIPMGYFGGIFARSGMATKRGLAPANMVGVVDSLYRGQVIVAIHNYSNDVQVIEVGEKIAQMVFLPCMYADFKVVDKLDDTERGEGGFGSSDKRKMNE